MLGPQHSVIFDLDGTLVDTAPDLCGALNHVLHLHGKPPLALSQMRNFVGQGARNLIERGLDHAGIEITEDMLGIMVEQFLEHYIANISKESRPFPGAVDVVKQMHGAKVKLGVCTNKREHLSRLLIDELNLTQFFPAIVGADSVPNCKPDPNHLFETIRQIGGDPRKSVLIGDSPTDVATAKAAGIPVIVVNFGYSEQPARELGGTHVIEHFDDLSRLLRQVM